MNEDGRSPYSPSVAGYALAILISLAVFALGANLVDGMWDFSWGVVVVIMVVGAIPAAVIGGLGAVVVHFTTRRVAGQGWHVLAATLAGLVAGALVYRDLPLALLLGCGACAGRLVVSDERFRGHARQSPGRLDR